ncbi:MAG: class I SAM-dependent methyltransferase [Verrucomicrobia bacterium]|jgi:methyl halide transferase|nr:class I SAM-dependent methyltransferase [Verrucomicrobiota bacterium]MBT7700675.1 class I SAM-dependent methyltransferase [Verrucomicrobiota bacterium]
MDVRREKWDGRYATGDLPWDTGRFDANLATVIAEWGIAPCPVLELGCGTGSNAIWLAAAGFDVTAVDISALALAQATTRAAEAEVSVRFEEVDMHHGRLPKGPFGLVFDRGCFHSSDGPEEHALCVRNVHDSLGPQGLWLSLIGSTDSPPRDGGPPQLSAAQIVSYVEPLFEIRLLKATHFDSNQPEPPPAWACLMRKREDTA